MALATFLELSVLVHIKLFLLVGGSEEEEQCGWVGCLAEDKVVK